MSGRVAFVGHLHCTAVFFSFLGAAVEVHAG